MKTLLFYICVICTFSSFSQDTLAELLDKHNKNSIPYISIEELTENNTEPILLDARELEEYNVSHLKNAIHVGFNKFDLKKTTKQLPNKQQFIVIYCSLGIRSEDIAEKLKKEGYTNVYNLYGGIFEWKNNDLPLFNLKDEETHNVHVFSKIWSTWLTKGIKIYE
ncbi:rhodanese-like domain-containing protein [Lacinutrix iliipiscaria]|uniref:Rhodanese-like domain-containing protein n=1 Tax=Lacinutrix iliipiscaria TaxID=1230532 RepID=A0ABW5WL20_9FLAO